MSCGTIMDDRTGFIGSSDAAAVLGVSPWRTPLDLYLSKLGEMPLDIERNVREKRRGIRLEPYILDALVEEHGFEIARRNSYYTDPKLDYLKAQIDGETAEGVLVECKTAKPWHVREWGTEYSSEVPLHYHWQAVHAMMVTGRERVIFAVLFGDDLKLFPLHRDEEEIESLRAHEVDFWENHVKLRVPPDAINRHDLALLYPRSLGGVKIATDAVLKDIEDLGHIKALRKQFETREEEIEDRLRAFFETAGSIMSAGRVIATYNSQKRRCLDQKALALAEPAIVERFTHEIESRVLRLKV